jgi:glycosyltransferase involved in cell wall biosynthesis
MAQYKLSIITINFNNLEGLKRTVESVINQTWKEFEYIIIDGGSTDGSSEYLDEVRNSISFAKSERDNGVYHAMNKGIDVANGEYCLFLNSGDELHDSSVVERSLRHLNSVDVICFDSVIRGEGEEYHTNHPTEMTIRFLWYSTICHQSVFIKKDRLMDYPYDENLKLVSDWKFFICSFIKLNATYMKVDDLLSIYYVDGVSSDPKNYKLLDDERQLVLRDEFKGCYNDFEEMFKLQGVFNLMRLSRKIRLLQKFRILDRFTF